MPPVAEEFKNHPFSCHMLYIVTSLNNVNKNVCSDYILLFLSLIQKICSEPHMSFDFTPLTSRTHTRILGNGIKYKMAYKNDIYN